MPRSPIAGSDQTWPIPWRRCDRIAINPLPLAWTARTKRGDANGNRPGFDFDRVRAGASGGISSGASPTRQLGMVGDRILARVVAGRRSPVVVGLLVLIGLQSS